ncbi:MAG: leucyl/phenylalanyl-tRNA--protein transferase, partial [Flavobacteriaceae bacterium]|nr:leucyl/phenylalanyl-tRNA--protein transferase [Flavobacteriaceae bacterium]
MVYLQENSPFPPVKLADEDGLLALGGLLTSERLMTAYRSGIFPWFSGNQPVLWWSPDPRMVLYPENFKTSKSLLQKIKSNRFNITFNTAFTDVIQACAQIKRKNESGTWITKGMQDAYIELHRLGHAISVEVWKETELIGGLYGIDLPEQKIFCGESMFHKETDASKIAFYHLVEKLKSNSYKLI